MNKVLSIFTLVPFFSLAQSFAPDPDELGTTAIFKDSSIFVAWATGVDVNRGYLNIHFIGCQMVKGDFSRSKIPPVFKGIIGA